MEWSQLIDDRKQTSSWNMDKEVTVDTINEIMAEVHRRSPSKQNVVQYDINVIGWDDKEFRNHFKQFTLKEPLQEDSLYNTQILAPWLLIFTRRQDAPIDRYTPGTSCADLITQFWNEFSLVGCEVGMAGMNVALSASAKGLDTGFCKCFDWNYKHSDVILEKLGISDLKDIHLSMGLGYGSSDKRTLDLTTNEFVNSEVRAGNLWKIEPKVAMDTYVKFI